MTVGKLKEFLNRFNDDVEVFLETWDDKRCDNSGKLPLILCIDDETVFNEGVILYGKKVKS